MAWQWLTFWRKAPQTQITSLDDVDTIIRAALRQESIIPNNPFAKDSPLLRAIELKCDYFKPISNPSTNILDPRNCSKTKEKLCPNETNGCKDKKTKCPHNFIYRVNKDNQCIYLLCSRHSNDYHRPVTDSDVEGFKVRICPLLSQKDILEPYISQNIRPTDTTQIQHLIRILMTQKNIIVGPNSSFGIFAANVKANLAEARKALEHFKLRNSSMSYMDEARNKAESLVARYEDLQTRLQTFEAKVDLFFEQAVNHITQVDNNIQDLNYLKELTRLESEYKTLRLKAEDEITSALSKIFSAALQLQSQLNSSTILKALPSGNQTDIEALTGLTTAVEQLELPVELMDTLTE